METRITLTISNSQNQWIDVSRLNLIATTSFIMTAFDPDQLDGRPEAQVTSGGDKETLVTLSSDELLLTQQLISKCYSYCCVSPVDVITSPIMVHVV